jgi:hypothetical protein
VDVLGHGLSQGSLARLTASSPRPRPRRPRKRRGAPAPTRRRVLRGAAGRAGHGRPAAPPGRSRRGPCAVSSSRACGRRANACRRVGPGWSACVGQNKTRSPPCMRCRGPCLASPHQVSQLPGLPGADVPPARARNPRKAQVALLLPRPGVASGQCPFLTVKLFYYPGAGRRKACPASFSSFFPVHTLSTECGRLSAARRGFPPPFTQAFTQVINRLPGVTRRNTESQARRHSLFLLPFLIRFCYFRGRSTEIIARNRLAFHVAPVPCGDEDDQPGASALR